MLAITKYYHAILASLFSIRKIFSITDELKKANDNLVVPNNHSKEKEIFPSLVKKSAKPSHYKILPPYGTGLYNIYPCPPVWYYVSFKR